MPTNWEWLKRAAYVEFQSLYSRMTDDVWNEALVQAIRDYSVDRPLLKTKTLTLLSTSTEVALPADFIAFEDLGGVDGYVDEPFLEFDWPHGRAYETGSFGVHGQQFLRFRTATAGTVTLRYWGMHADDATTLTPRDVVRIKPLYFSFGYGALAGYSSSRGRIQAGPVSWDDGASARVYEVSAKRWLDQYGRTAGQRAYGRRSRGGDFNLREMAISGAGESLG